MELKLRKNLTNHEISQLFDFISGVLDLQGANKFRVRAYDNAASTVAQLDQELKDMFLSNPKFAELPGIGNTLQQKLTELFTTGNIKAFQEYVKDLPAGVFTLSTVHGIGVKKAYKIASAFNLGSEEEALATTMKLAQQGKIRHLDSFGEKSEKELITALENHIVTKRIPYNEALQVANRLKEELITCEDIEKVEVLGSLRRQTETVGDIDLGIAIKDIGRVKECVKQLKSVKRIIVAGDQLLRIQTLDNWQVDIKISALDEWGSFLQHFTGSKEHNIKLREYALRQGYSLSEHGIKMKSDQDRIKKFKTEEEFYTFLGLKWIPPEKRIGAEEIEQSKV
ncbi:MAG TPA: hypothetical protein VF209_01815 [Patescibacteria group bacterium]